MENLLGVNFNCRYVPAKFRPYVISETGDSGGKLNLTEPCFPEGLVREFKVGQTMVPLLSLAYLTV